MYKCFRDGTESETEICPKCGKGSCRIEMETVRAGEMFALTATYIDDVYFGVYRALKDFQIMTGYYTPNFHVPEEKTCAHYIEQLIADGFIENMELRDICLGDG